MKYSLSSKEIPLVLKNSSVFKTHSFYVRLMPGDSFKVGFGVSRHFGSAVVRNKFKRQLRAFFKDNGMRNMPFSLLISPRNIRGFGSINRDLNKFYQHMISKKEVFNG